MIGYFELVAFFVWIGISFICSGWLGYFLARKITGDVDFDNPKTMLIVILTYGIVGLSLMMLPFAFLIPPIK